MFASVLDLVVLSLDQGSCRLNSDGTQTVLDLNDDVGDSTDSRRTRNLAPGRYMVAASTYAAGETGDYRLHIWVIQAQACSAYAMPTAGTASSVLTAWVATG